MAGVFKEPPMAGRSHTLLGLFSCKINTYMQGEDSLHLSHQIPETVHRRKNGPSQMGQQPQLFCQD